MLINRIRRARCRTPGEIARRTLAEVIVQVERLRGEPLGKKLPGKLLERLDAPDVDNLWTNLAARPHPAMTGQVDWTAYDKILPGDSEKILAIANSVLSCQISVACCGDLQLELPIHWHQDPLTGDTWPAKFFHDLDLLDLSRSSDVRRVWELSRLQWLIPVGQAYQLTRDERYASFAEAVFDDWIDANHYGLGVNWGVAMEPAMRIFGWTWFFHVFANSQSWSETKFRAKFMTAVYRHAVFVQRHIENWGAGGNHLIADAAALVVAGHFFGRGAEPTRWQASGWRLLERHLGRQVASDGVDFEGSIAYHRVVYELIYWAVRYRQVTTDLDVCAEFMEKLARMSHFTAAAIQPSGTVPAWGDSDDARVYRFGSQDIRDHRYIGPIQGALENPESSVDVAAAVVREVAWSVGFDRLALTEHSPTRVFRSFEESGIYILTSDTDHVFVDCGAVGSGGRGGHGHNDCLSFEATLNGVAVITDSGTYAYSGDPGMRNKFRGTAAHATLVIGGEEQNRIVPPPELWLMHNDARPNVRRWKTGCDLDIVEAEHSGYRRLVKPVTPVRVIALDKKRHRLLVADRIEGAGEHLVEIVYPLAVGAVVEPWGHGWFTFELNGHIYELAARDVEGWGVTVEEGWYSASYGKKSARPVILFRRDGRGQTLEVGIGPVTGDGTPPQRWISKLWDRSRTC